MKKYLNFILLLILSLVFLSGCMSDLVVPENDLNQSETESSLTEGSTFGDSVTETEGSVKGKGTLEIYLTDAPGDYKEVNINISKIEGHIAVDGSEEEDEGYWDLLKEWESGYNVDLIKLENVSVLLASLQLDGNKYTQLRIFLKGGASLGLEGEEGAQESIVQVPLEIPSSANSGIKLNHPFEIMEGIITKLTIDFDAQKSVIQTGNGKYKMKPVISLSSETYSSDEVPEGVGTVYGKVSYEDVDLGLTGISGANIELTGGAYIFDNTAATDADGLFDIDNVPAGDYTIHIHAAGYGDYSEDIEIIVNTDTEVNVVFYTEINDIDLFWSDDKTIWNAVTGDLIGGYHLSLDSSKDFYYLDANNLVSNVPLQDGDYGFYVYPSEQDTDYWNAKGVNASASAGSWQEHMYQIITGVEPILYLQITSSGTEFALLDGLQMDFTGSIEPLRINGDYPTGTYHYTGEVIGINGAYSDTITARITFSGPSAL